MPVSAPPFVREGKVFFIREEPSSAVGAATALHAFAPLEVLVCANVSVGRRSLDTRQVLPRSLVNSANQLELVDLLDLEHEHRGDVDEDDIDPQQHQAAHGDFVEYELLFFSDDIIRLFNE